MPDRYARLRHVQSLDPENDFAEIYRNMVQFDFAKELVLAFYLAFIRPFALPSISRITAATGEITKRTRKRTNDTAILLYTLYEHGFDHELGREAIRRINQIHRHWRATNSADDYVYVVGTLLIPPMRFLERYGWRRPCCHERRSAFLFYRTLAHHMAVEVPGDYDSFVEWFDDFEQRHLAHDPSNEALMAAVHESMAQRLPRLLRWPVNRAIDSLIDDPVRVAIGLPQPPWPIRVTAQVLLWLAAKTAHFRQPPTAQAWVFGAPMPSYPDGYTSLDEIGPPDQPDGAIRGRAGGPVKAHPATES